ncbi:MAG: hypothetical protein Q9182_003122 [Xanthomendoza sp. 2 TL-2023]
MKRQRIGDDGFGRGVTIQQRRSGPTTAAPQLTLTLPPSTSATSARGASAMVWMPDEQMWLTADEVTYQRPQTAHHRHQSAYAEHAVFHQRSDYPRSEPSPGPYTFYDITPPDSPVVSQFRSLLTEPRNEEMLSPLFQEAISSVPFSDSASLYSRPSEESVREPSSAEQEHERQPSRSSGQESFHSAIEFLAGGPVRPLGNCQREHGVWGSQARKLTRSSSS